MRLKGLLNRIEEPLTRMGDTTRQDNRLRIDDRGIVGQSQSQDITRATEHLNSHLVTLFTTLEDGSRRQFLKVTHQRRGISLCHQLTGCAGDTCGPCISLQTTLMATTTRTTSIHDTGMSELTCKPQMAHMVGPFCEETTAQTNAKANDDEVLHTVGTTKGIFSQCRHMGIVRQGYGESQTIAKHGCHRDDTLPRQVRCILDTSGDRAGTGRTHTDRADPLVAAIGLNQFDNLLTELCHEFVHIRIVNCGEGIFRQDITSDIDDGVGSSLDTDINANHF